MLARLYILALCLTLFPIFVSSSKRTSIIFITHTSHQVSQYRLEISDSGNYSQPDAIVIDDDVSNYNLEKKTLPKSTEELKKIREWLQPTS